jgi:hypothetical protein
MLNPSYGILSSMIASLVESTLYQPATAVAAPPSSDVAVGTDTEVCALSTVYITVTGLAAQTSPAGSKTTMLSTITMGIPPSVASVPANPLYSQYHTASTDALSATASYSTVTSGAVAAHTSAVVSNTTSHGTNSTNPAPSTSPFLTPNNSSSSTAPAAGLYSHMALVLSFVGALALFAI